MASPLARELFIPTPCEVPTEMGVCVYVCEHPSLHVLRHAGSISAAVSTGKCSLRRLAINFTEVWHTFEILMDLGPLRIGPMIMYYFSMRITSRITS
jgi:hypothetical protein